MGQHQKFFALLLLTAVSLSLVLANILGPAAAQNSAAPFWVPREADIDLDKNCVDGLNNASAKMEKSEEFRYSCGTTTSANVPGYRSAILNLYGYPFNPVNDKKYAAVTPSNGEYHIVNFTLEWSWRGRNLPSDIVPPVDLNKFAQGLSGATRVTNTSYFGSGLSWLAPVPAANNLCPAVITAIDNSLTAVANKRLPKGAFVTQCVLANGPYLEKAHQKILIMATVIVPQSRVPGTLRN